MGLLNSIGAFADRVSTSQQNNSFYLVKSPLFMQFLDICVLRYPDPLDLYDWSYEIVLIYFVAGAIDYGIITMAMSTYSPFALLISHGVNHADAVPSLSELRSPQSKVFAWLLFISFAIRAWRLGLGNIQKTCNLHHLQWHEMRKLCTLILLLCPALAWHLIFETILNLFQLDENRPWLGQLFWLVLSRDWDTAQLFSGWLATKDKEVLKQESAMRLNETWTGFFIRCLKITAVATPLEMAVRNLPYLVVALIVAVGQNRAAIGGFVGGLFTRFRDLALVKKFRKLDESVVRARDHLALLLIRGVRRGRDSLRRMGFPQHTAHLKRLVGATLDAFYLACNPYFTSALHGFSKYGRTFQSFIISRKSKTELSQSSNKAEGSVPRRFRLLEVEPSASKDQVMTCNMSWYDLEAAPKYTAVSYVWGSSEPNSTMILNGKECRTTSSALIALKGLRSRWRKKKFWIDAICIDQSSNADKAEQIAIMAGIYRNAKQVTVWLGSDQESTLALSLARRLWIRTRLSGVTGSSSYSLDAPEPAWQALLRLLQNCWFQRSWVVQEVMSSNVVVRYGNAEIDWVTLSRFAMAVESEPQSMQKLYSLSKNKDPNSSGSDALKIKYIRIMEEFRSMHSAEDQHLSLLFYLIRMFRSGCRFKATNTQDRIYALLNLSGLAEDTVFNDLLNKSRMLGNVNPQNTPDYSERLSEFFTTVARHFLSSGPENRRLDFLAHAGTAYTYGRDRLPNLPSWVPDWSLEDPPCLPLIGYDGTLELLQHPRLKGILVDVADMQSYDEISFSGRPEQERALKRLNAMAKTMNETAFYRATKETLPDLMIHEDNNILELQGVSIDRIQTIGRVYPSTSLDSSSEPPFSSITPLLMSWYALAFQANDEFNPIILLARRINFERTLLADLSQPTFDFTLPDAPVRPVPLMDLGVVTILLGLGYGAVTLDSIPGGEPMVRRLKECIKHLNVTCAGRAFGVTEEGRMGLFMQGCEVGDEVCLYEGSGLPFVVRKVDGGEEMPDGKDSAQDTGFDGKKNDDMEDGETKALYELVGAAYIQGIMDGEAVHGSGNPAKFLLK
ncbi:Heterokaryon incompatibility protein 6,OR allele [Lachnellula cervina]|uniref:Heterokaryon incompatibility protein 6,OR allele n=1 Tax=Lachnellula cervina TaxID=1316786 RepID=A0A7D8V159_9HELO|nr:Heterokaryon incompatibility protein 6,OR allele [Lachnellula cervina]